jgi:hypothetical protein
LAEGKTRPWTDKETPDLVWCLVGWLCGEPALYAERLSHQEVATQCQLLISLFMGGQVDRPLLCTLTRWGSNPSFRWPLQRLHCDFWAVIQVSN